MVEIVTGLNFGIVERSGGFRDIHDTTNQACAETSATHAFAVGMH